MAFVATATLIEDCGEDTMSACEVMEAGMAGRPRGAAATRMVSSMKNMGCMPEWNGNGQRPRKGDKGSFDKGSFMQGTSERLIPDGHASFFGPQDRVRYHKSAWTLYGGGMLM